MNKKNILPEIKIMRYIFIYLFIYLLQVKKKKKEIKIL